MKVSLKSADRGWICAKRLDWILSFAQSTSRNQRSKVHMWQKLCEKRDFSCRWCDREFYLLLDGTSTSLSRCQEECARQPHKTCPKSKKTIYWGAKRQTDAKRSILFQVHSTSATSRTFYKTFSKSRPIWERVVAFYESLELPRIIILASHLLLSCDVSMSRWFKDVKVEI